MKLIKKSSKANESELIKKKDNTRSNRVILPFRIQAIELFSR